MSNIKSGNYHMDLPGDMTDAGGNMTVIVPPRSKREPWPLSTEGLARRAAEAMRRRRREARRPKPEILGRLSYAVETCRGTAAPDKIGEIRKIVRSDRR